MPKLIYTTATGQRSEILLGPSMPVVLVGRLAECQIQTVDTSVSRKHSQFTWHPGDSVDVQDLGSSNGTFVNDQKVGTAALNNFDKVRCGNFQVEFHAQPATQAEPPGGRMSGPPGAGDPTQYGPVSQYPGAPPSAGPGGGGPAPFTPYLNDPSMALPPESADGAYAHIETVDHNRQDQGGYPGPGGGPSPYAGPSSAPQPPPPQASPGYREPPPAYGGGGGSELDRAVRRADALGREVDELRYENQRMRSSAGGSAADQEAIRRLEAEARRLREENETLYEERKEADRMKAQMDALSDRNVELKDQFSSLQEQQGELRDKLRDAREDLDNALFKRDELSSDTERLENDKAELFDQLTKLKIEYNHMERAHEQTQKDYGLLEYEYKRLDETNQELERELRNVLDGENEQSDALTRLQAIVDEKESIVSNLKEKVEGLKEDLRETEGTDSTWMVEVEKLKQENEELVIENEELLEKIDDLREVISAQKATSSTANEGMADDLANLKEENERLLSRIKDYVPADSYDKIQAENDELRIRISKVQGDLESSQASTPSGTEELLSQIRELTAENHKLEVKLKAASSTTDTNPGGMRAVTPDKAMGVFTDVNSMVSAWRANLETMQLHVGDLGDLFKGIGVMDGVTDEIKDAIKDADPDWACESMGDTVKQILGDSKKIKNLLLELRKSLEN